MITSIFKRKKDAARLSEPASTIIGKAPFHGDFIRQGLTHGNAMHIDHWLEQGFSQLMKESKLDYQGHHHTLYYCMRFLAQPTLASGALFASHDFSGRAYPLSFTQWSHVPDILATFTPFLPAYSDWLWDKLTELSLYPWQQAQEMANWLAAATKRHQQPRPEGQCLQSMQKLIGIPVQQWAATWPNASHIIAEGVEALIHYDVADHGLVVPIPTEGKLALPYVVFWLQLCEQFLPMRWHQVFWYQKEDAAELLIQYQGMPSTYLGYLLSPRIALPKNYRRLTGDKKQALLPQIEAWFSQPGLTLSQLMHNIMHLPL